MDRYEYKEMVEKIRGLIETGDLEEAKRQLDANNWRKIPSVNALMKAAELYEEVGSLEEAKELLMTAHERSPIGRMVIYRIALVCIRLNQFEEAEDYYQEFLRVAPRDSLRYVIQYQLARAKGASDDSLIEILEELKDNDFLEDWALELALFYQKTRRVDQCVALCDEIILWFGDGPYVEKALELKMIYAPLDPEQEEKYLQLRQNYRDEVKEIAPQEEAEKEDSIAIPEISIPSSKYNTMNLQAEIQRNIEEIMSAEKTEDISAHMAQLKYLTGEFPFLRVSEGTHEEGRKRAQETQRIIDADLRQKYSGLNIDQDGQLSMDTESKEESQIQGQMTLEDLTKDWEEKKKQAEEALQEADEKRFEATKAQALVEANEIMERLTGVLPRLEAGASVEELMEEQILDHASAKLQQVAQSVGRQGQEIDFQEARKAVSDINQMLQREIDRLSKGDLPDDTNQEASAEGLLEAPAQETLIEETPEEVPVEETSVEEAPTEVGEITLDPEDAPIIPDFDFDSLGEDEEEAEPSESDSLNHPLSTEGEMHPEMEESLESTPVEDKQEFLLDYESNAVTTPIPSLEEDLSEETEEEEIPVPASMEEDLIYEEEEELEDETAAEDVRETKEEDVYAEGEAPLTGYDLEESEDEKRDAIEKAFLLQSTRASWVTDGQEFNSVESMQAANIFYNHNEQQNVVEEPPRRLRKEEKERFSYHVAIEGMEARLSKALVGVQEGIKSKNRRQHLKIIGSAGSGKTSIATAIIELSQKEEGLLTGVTGKIDAKKLNEKNIIELFDKIRHGSLIIENAGELSRVSIATLNTLLDTDTSGVLIVIEDEMEALHKMLQINKSFASKFANEVRIPILTTDELVAFGRSYANDQSCNIDTMGVLALYNRINLIQRIDHPTSLSEVIAIVDEAIRRAKSGGLRKRFSRLGNKKMDEEGRLILREKDFEI